MYSFLILLAVLASASAFTSFDSPYSYGNYLEYAEKDCRCKNGRCVTDSKGNTKCNCRPGYALQDEETCEKCDCGSKGKCFFLLQRNPHGEVGYEKKCLCDKDYAQKDGYCVECVCGENSKCEFDNGEKNCYCIEGYAEKDGVCTECNCGENGECKFENDQKKCYCYEDYLVNNGICEECYCGDNGTCSFQNGVKTCACDTGFKEKEGICELCNCGHFGVDCRYEKQEKICQCRDGYAQKLGICEECGCGDHSLGCTFSNDLKKNCKCENGYVQRDEECKVGCGLYRHCENGGLCDNGYCKCLAGTSGDFCEVIDDCRSLCPNKTDITCAYDVLLQKAYCKCLQEELGYDSLTQKCRKTCSDDYWRCENEGSCVLSGNNSFCRCFNGTSGDMCEVVDDCHQKRLTCGTEAKCVFDVPKKKAVCACVDPNKSYDFLLNRCKRDCEEQSCANGGACEYSGDSRFCKCIEGTSGDLCDVVDECKETDKCGDEADCYFDVHKRTASCKCHKRGSSLDPTDKKCKRNCELYVPHCANGGICESSRDWKFCRCLEGTSGEFCEIVDKCLQNDVCGYEAECYFDVNKLKASCKCHDRVMSFDKEKRRCKRNCEEQSCENGGNCQYAGDSKFCKCIEGTSGDLCNVVDECEQQDKCGDEANCYFDVNKRRASCKCHKCGKSLDPTDKKCKRNCELYVPHCANRGICETSGDWKFCRCLEGTSGEFCEMMDKRLPS